MNKTQEQHIFEILWNTVTDTNTEYTEPDSFGNWLCSFLISDDVALTFFLDGNDKVKKVIVNE